VQKITNSVIEDLCVGDVLIRNNGHEATVREVEHTPLGGINVTVDRFWEEGTVTYNRGEIKMYFQGLQND